MAYAGMVDVTRVSEVMPYNDPLVGSFVAKNAEEHTGIGLYPEIVLNDLQETKTIARFANCAKVRIRGMEDIMLGNYSVGFAWLRKTFSGQIEWSPTDGLGLAAATAVEWLMSGCGTEVVTSFEGIGGFAPFEEVVLALRSLRKRNIGKQFTMFPRMRELMEMITGRHCPPNKPVLGRSIFSVESGIHVDGIMKQPKCYEPFPPELVGQSRSFLLGKLSGKASVLVKMGQLGFSGGESEADELAARVKGESARKNRCLSDAEFAELYREICDGRVHQ
jgi:homocitrate synthase NifV